MLEITTSETDNVVLVEAAGRIDSMNAHELGEALSNVIDKDQVQIVLDLSGVDYMSSAGLREIVAALKRVKRVAGDVRIARPSDRVLEILEMAGLDTILRIYPTQDEAVESY